jgi:hypothetical protein
MLLGLAKAKLGGTVAVGDPLCVTSAGKLVKADEDTEFVIGYATEAGVSNDIRQVFLCQAGMVPSTEDSEVLAAAADYSTTGQYLAMKINSAGKWVKCSTAGEVAQGILQNAPVADADARVKTQGSATFYTVSGVTRGDALATSATGSLETAAAGQAIVGYALETVAATSTGLMHVDIGGLYSVDGVALANTKIWIGSAAGVAAAQTIGGDATLAANGTLTVTDFSTTSAGDSAGDLVYRDAADTFERLAKGTAGQVLSMNAGATAPAWASVSGDASGSTSTPGLVSLIDRYRKRSATTDSTAGAYTYLAAGILGGVYLRDPAGASRTDVTDTAVNIVGAFTNSVIGAWMDFYIVNTADAAETITLTAGAGITLSPTTIEIGRGQVGHFLVRLTNVTASSEAATIYQLSNRLATGQIVIGSTNGEPSPLPVGTAHQLLQADGTTASWVTMSGDATLTAGAITVTDVTVGSDATGDLPFKASATAYGRLPIAGIGKKVTSNGTLPVWDRNKIVGASFSGLTSADAPILEEWDHTAAPGTTGALCRCITPTGLNLGYWVLGAGQTILGPVGATDAIDVSCDQTDDEGLELFSNWGPADGRLLSVGFDGAFYFLVKFSIANIDGTDDFFVGFRKFETVQANMTDYDTYCGLGLNTAADPGALKQPHELNGAAGAYKDTTQTFTQGTDIQFKILVSAAGVCTVQHDIAVPGTLAAPSAVDAFTFDDGDQLLPVVRFLHANAAQAGAILIKNWEVGYQ